MKKGLLFSLALTGFFALNAQQQFTGAEAAALVPGSKSVLINAQSRVPSFVIMRNDASIKNEESFVLLRHAFKATVADNWQLKRKENDKIGYTHYRYDQFFGNIRVENGEYIVHEKNGHVVSMNGMWFDGIQVNTVPALNVNDAVQKAKDFVGAASYKWENSIEENHLKMITGNPDATYFPKGELVVVCNGGDIYKKEYRLAWKLDVYADQPMSRQWVFVDAHSGQIVHSVNRIHTIDTPGSGLTMYSGTQNFTCDSFNNQYRLREAARGQGIQTLDLNNGTNYGNAVDFLSNTPSFTTTTNNDHAANDAHWGAEGTYDFYLNEMNRNGLDGSGMQMFSYVHYSNNYNNAFWDGQRMTYGDGNGQPGGFNPLTAIDVCGHEFTHGVTEFSANLVYQDESGALNESFSDIFGAAIEFYKKPAQADWLMGEEITVTANTALRSMSNPNQYGDPDCYTGTNWYTGTADNGGVHTNSGVQNYWYYLLSIGGSGTNDLNNTFSVTGIGWYSGAEIAFRNLTVYLVSSSVYADARTYAIQSAEDIFGACSPEVAATTNAWYACGVGGPYNPVVTAAFTSNTTSSCSLPFTVNFSNTSNNASNFIWYFGDNTTSTLQNPSHTYTNPGTYTVSLAVNSACGSDSIAQTSYITINTPPAATATGGGSSCQPASFNLSATVTGTASWYAQAVGGTPVATGANYTTPVLSTTTTYYVENAVPQPPGNVGPANSNFGTGGQHNNTSTQYLEFTVLQNCTLSTALVNAGSSGNKTFTLWDSNGNVINNYTVNVPGTGNQTVTLNIPLTPGAYRIGGTQMNLYRNNSGAQYPYTLNNVITITGSSAGSAYYYYLYNWGITLSPCVSQRFPVTCTIGAPVTTLDVSGYDTLCNTAAPINLNGGSPSGGVYSGPGVNNGVLDPVAAGPGVHYIYYSYTDQSNCTGVDSQAVFIDICTGISNNAAQAGFSVYPNPNNGEFTILMNNSSNDQQYTVAICNMLGQEILNQRYSAVTGINRFDVNAAGLAKGVYLVQVKSSSAVLTRRIEIR
ncbi:MAG: hypothetical protein Fur0041_02630 [Bacteroidia bacterium]